MTNGRLHDPDRLLDGAEFERLVAMPLSPEAVQEILELRRWFLGRYPSPLDRFAYLRRKRREWSRRPTRR